MNKLFLILMFLATNLAVSGQNTGAIRGTVTSQVTGARLAGVTIQITQLNRSVETDGEGKYEFAGLTPGRHTLVTHIDGFSDQTLNVVLSAGATSVIDFSLSLLALREEVTVTATGTEESVFQSFQSVNSIGSTQIREQAASGIGEILERESAVGKRSFGPGTSRPVIRGFDGDRVLVVQDGIRNGSLGSQSGDHGEPVDTLNLERIEVIKGPGTLLYGSNAIGGVVNAVTSDEDDPHEGLRGSFTGLGATNNRQGGISGGLEYGWQKLLFKVHGNFLREGDYKTPLGRIPNSSSRGFGGNTSLGYYGLKGFLLGSFTGDRRRYGTPYSPLFEAGDLLTDTNGDPCDPTVQADCEYDIFLIRDRFSRQLPDVPDEAIDIKMRRNNYRVRGGFHDVSGPIERANFSLDVSRYRHDEIETEAGGTDEVATSFFNNVTSFRSVFTQARRGALTGQFGFEGFHRNYLTQGAEQLIDGRVRQNSFAAFTLQELSVDRIAFQFGARVETNRYRPENTSLYARRGFTGLSGAGAARVALWNGASFVANFTSAYRAPSLEELYNEGPHIGTVTFEVGDQMLRRERSNGIEVSLRQRVKRFRLNGSVFHYRIGNFVFLEPRDADGNGRVDIEDNLPVGNFVQGDARFTGADATLEVDATDWLGLFAVADVVRAELQNGDIPLPRITPPRLRIGGDLRYKGLSVRPEVVFTGARGLDHVFTLETPTAGYRLFNVNASYTYATTHVAHTFSLSTSNLGNRLYRNHLSFIKDLAPEQGRVLRASYTIRFF